MKLRLTSQLSTKTNRQGDQFTAGVVVNSRLGGTPTVTVEARGQGVVLTEPPAKSATLETGRGREVRFAFRGVAGFALGGCFGWGFSETRGGAGVCGA